MTKKHRKLDWLDEFEEFADEILSQQQTSGCDQIHPIIRKWYIDAMDDDPPLSRASVMQAMACLTTEIMSDMPESIFTVMAENLDEEEVALWLQEILMLGRVFEQALRNGQLDDL